VTIWKYKDWYGPRSDYQTLKVNYGQMCVSDTLIYITRHDVLSDPKRTFTPRCEYLIEKSLLRPKMWSSDTTR